MARVFVFDVNSDFLSKIYICLPTILIGMNEDHIRNEIINVQFFAFAFYIYSKYNIIAETIQWRQVSLSVKFLT